MTTQMPDDDHGMVVVAMALCAVMGFIVGLAIGVFVF